MKPKHVEARIKQCLAIAECSPCSRRKFGALLLDPTRNVLLMDGYNGGPRGGGAPTLLTDDPHVRGELCGGDRCLRDGLREDEVVVVNGKHVHVRGKHVWFPNGCPRGYGDEAAEFRRKILDDNPPIRSGTRYEVGCHHAEMNVITNAAARGVATAGAWLIVTGEPCVLCAKLIHHAGIVKVICVKGGFLGGDDGPSYLLRHGVEVEYVEGPQDPRTSIQKVEGT